jgi:hypothetical protein
MLSRVSKNDFLPVSQIKGPMKRIQNPSVFAALLTVLLLIQVPSQAATATRPVLIISYPTLNLSVSNATITVSGKTSDKVAVKNVFYQLNGAGWEPAVTTNDWANWTAPVTLTKLGANSVQAYAVDAGTNYSLTNTVKFAYAPAAPLAVQVVGLGAVTPDYNGKWLLIGNRYSITAKADKGFAFLKWSGSLSTTNPTLSFVMQSNLTFIAAFADVTPPVAIVLSPKVHQSVSNAEFTVTGKASDNVGVTNVWYQLNGAGWTAAETTNGWTNWTAQVTLTPGANLVQAFAEDAAGLRSKTNSVSFVYEPSGSADWAPSSLSGLTAQISWADVTTNDSMMSFGASTYSQSMLPGTNQDSNSVGNYTYVKLGANTALLTLSNTAPPNETGAAVTAVTFTNSNAAVWFVTNTDGSLYTGGMVLMPAPNVAPASVAGLTVHAVISSGILFTLVLTDSTVTDTDYPSEEVYDTSSYTFTRYSPVGGLLTEHYTSPSSAKGAVGYTILTWSASKAGSWFWVGVLPDGGAVESDFGTFTTP